MTPHEQFWTDALAAATAANHPFPKMAASEAALESAWGTSQLARLANNLLGIKQHRQPLFETFSLPTREWVTSTKYPSGVFVIVQADFVKYPSWTDCFADAIAMVKRIAVYADALAATDPVLYERALSAHWATDPHRADKVIAIYQAIEKAQT